MTAFAFSTLPACGAGRIARSCSRNCTSSASGFCVGGPRLCLQGRRSNLSHPQYLTITRIAAVADPPAEESEVVAAESDPLDDKAAMYKHFESLLEKFAYDFKVGDKVVGTVFRVDAKGALVDIGSKGAAYCPLKEVSLCKVDRATQVLASDQRREFIITRDDTGRAGEIELSIKSLDYSVAWQRVRQLQEEDVTVTGTVVSANRGGLMVDVEQLHGFVPSSHISMPQRGEELVGQQMPLKFLEVDEERSRIVFSNRRAADSSQASYKVGDVVVGTVQAVKPYGAFIDLGNGRNGLLHISQISHDRVASVEAILSEGDKLKVMILSQDSDRGRVSLSTKKLEPTPGDMLRDPALVYERADEMAKEFKQRVAVAEQAAAAQDARARSGMAETEDLMQ